MTQRVVIASAQVRLARATEEEIFDRLITLHCSRIANTHPQHLSIVPSTEAPASSMTGLADVIVRPRRGSVQ